MVDKVDKGKIMRRILTRLKGTVIDKVDKGKIMRQILTRLKEKGCDR